MVCGMATEATVVVPWLPALLSDGSTPVAGSRCRAPVVVPEFLNWIVEGLSRETVAVVPAGTGTAGPPERIETSTSPSTTCTE